MQILINWLLQKPSDLDLHCLQRQGMCGFSRTRVKANIYDVYLMHLELADFNHIMLQGVSPVISE